MLYDLAATPSNHVFHPVTTGDNNVYCQKGEPSTQPPALQCPSAGVMGYLASNADAATGYNLVTGLGSVDANALALALKSTLEPDFALTAAALAPTPVSAGQSTTATITIAPIAGSAQMTVNFAPGSCTGLPAGATCAFNPTSKFFDGTDPVTTTLTIATAANMAPSGPTMITVTPTNSPNTKATVSLTVGATTEFFTLKATAVTFPVAVGGTAQIPITVNSTTGFINNSNSTTALPLTYTCTGSPSLGTSEISCQLPSGGQPTNLTSVTVSLVTTPVTSQLHPPLGGTRIFYALLLPGLFGVVLGTGSRTRGLRLLSLIVVLGFSTLWLGACGGSSSNNNTLTNPGTPPGQYKVTISATTGGANPLTSSLSVTLNVTQ
jgi:hypothetical protein